MRTPECVAADVKLEFEASVLGTDNSGLDTIIKEECGTRAIHVLAQHFHAHLDAWNGALREYGSHRRQTVRDFFVARFSSLDYGNQTKEDHNPHSMKLSRATGRRHHDVTVCV